MKRINTSAELRHIGQAGDGRGLIVSDQQSVRRLTTAQAGLVRAEFVRGWPVGGSLVRQFNKR
jgi:hypothetical protein